MRKVTSTPQSPDGGEAKANALGEFSGADDAIGTVCEIRCSRVFRHAAYSTTAPRIATSSAVTCGSLRLPAAAVLAVQAAALRDLAAPAIVGQLRD